MNNSTDNESMSLNENADANYNPTNRDFQKTSEEKGLESASGETNKEVKADDNYNHSDRDFQRTDGEADDVSESEKEHEEANRRTEDANTQPTKENLQ